MSQEIDTSIRSDWSPERARVCDPEHFVVTIELALDLYCALTEADRMRLYGLLVLVKQTAKKLAANMTKGVLRYKAEDANRTVDAWLDYLTDDAADTLNYVALLRQAREREKEAA